MSLLKNRFRAYFVSNLMLMILANILFACAFCVLYVGDNFTADYYYWLKVVDMACYILITVALFLSALLLSLPIKPKRQKLFTPLNILEILIIIVAFVNLISFYEGAVFGVLVAGIVAFCLSQLVLVFMYGSQDEDFLEVSTKLVFNDLDFETSRPQHKNYCFLFGGILNIILYVILFTWYILDVLPDCGLGQTDTIWTTSLLACFVGICIVLSVFGMCFFKASSQKVKSESWVMVSLIGLNMIVFLAFGIICFALTSMCNYIIFICIILALTQVSNICWLKDLINDRQIFKIIVNSA